MTRLLAGACLLALTGCGGCFNLPNLIPDAGQDPAFEAIVGPSGPITQGGHTAFGGVDFDTTLTADGGRTIIVSSGGSNTLAIVYRGDTVAAIGDFDQDGV